MPKIVVSDTSCFIALSKIKELQILQKLYGRIITTPTVVDEFGEHLPEWIQVQPPKDLQKQQLLELQVDRGEASAVILALELEADLIILDDYKARLSAEKLGMNITGTLGVIIRAKKAGILHSIQPLIDKLRKTDFRVSEELLIEALKIAGE